MRGVTTAAGQTGKKRPQAPAEEEVDPKAPASDAEQWGDAGKCSDTEESESDVPPAPHVTKMLRQLCGASQVEAVGRQHEVDRKSTLVATRHNFYNPAKVTSVAQEEQSALPVGVIKMHDDTDDDDCFLWQSY